MSSRVRAYIRQHHVGLLCLFLFATSGTAYALDGSNTVFSDDIVDGEVRKEDIRNGHVTNAELGVNSVRTGAVADDTLAGGGLQAVDLQPGSVTSSEIAANSVFSSDVATNSLNGTDVLDNSLTGTDIANQSLDSGEIEDNSLTGTDIANQSVDGGEIENNSLTGADVQNGTLGSSDLSQIVTRTNDSVTGSVANDLFVGVACQPGEVLVAGGGGVIGAIDVDDRISESIPLEANGSFADNGDVPVGWQVRGHIDKDNAFIRVSALCLRPGL